MLRRSSPWKIVSLALLGLPGFALADRFTPPAEGPVAFRRDLLPLDVDAMVRISNQLVLLAGGLSGETAEERRGAAQSLALAMSLNPANTKARELLKAFADQNHKPQVDPEAHAKSRARLWQNLAWLETPEAGNDGRALAACLADILVLTDAEHPRSEEMRKTGEKGAWADWVPPLAAYQKAEVIIEPELVAVPEPEVVAEPSIRLQAAQISTLLWTQKNEDQPWVRELRPLDMAASAFQPTEEQKSQRFRLTMGNIELTGTLRRTLRTIEEALAQHHGKLPERVEISLFNRELETSLKAKKAQNISAAAFVLGSAAISGNAPDGIVIGSISDEGNLVLPADFWNQLRDLSNEEHGARLILPSAAAAYLPSLLALEEPDFFFKFEVLLASDLTELIRFSLKQPSEADAGPMARFAEIRTKASGLPTSQYVANRFVRQRLADIGTEAPWHASARMLAVQGAGERPTRLPRMILAKELLNIIRDVPEITKNRSPFPEPAYIKRVEEVYNESRKTVDALERYVDTTDRGIHAKTRDMINLIRGLARECNKVRNDPQTSFTIQSAVAELTRSYEAVQLSLAAMADE